MSYLKFIPPAKLILFFGLRKRWGEKSAKKCPNEVVKPVRANASAAFSAVGTSGGFLVLRQGGTVCCAAVPRKVC